MKIKNVQSIICLVIFSLFSNQAWAADWIYFDTAAAGDVYYDKSSIKKVSENIISVWNKDILSEKAKKKYFSLLKGIHKAPKNPSMLNYYTKLMEIDCANKKIKDLSVIFYNEKSKVVYASPKSESGEWNDILPNTVGEKLINIVSCESVVSKVEEPVTPTVDAPVETATSAAVTAPLAVAAPVETGVPAPAAAPVEKVAPVETTAPTAASAPTETAAPAIADAAPVVAPTTAETVPPTAAPAPPVETAIPAPSAAPTAALAPAETAVPVPTAAPTAAPAPVETAVPAPTAAPTAAPAPAAAETAPAETATSTVTDKNVAQDNNKQIGTKSASEEAVRNLLTKWLNSWKSGDMKTYRSCYESNFKSEVTYTNASVSYKTNVRQKNKKINISIDELQISADENMATAVFAQYYSSSILKYSGKKKLELRKINDEWKIYREIM